MSLQCKGMPSLLEIYIPPISKILRKILLFLATKLESSDYKLGVCYSYIAKEQFNQSMPCVKAGNMHGKERGISSLFADGTVL